MVKTKYKIWFVNLLLSTRLVVACQVPTTPFCMCRKRLINYQNLSSLVVLEDSYYQLASTILLTYSKYNSLSHQ